MFRNVTRPGPALILLLLLPCATGAQRSVHAAEADPLLPQHAAAGAPGEVVDPPLADPPEASSHPAEHGDEPAVDQVPHHPEFRNEFMLFMGDTRKGGQNEFTIGFDYLRSLGHHWGVGIYLDYARGQFEREYIAGLAAFWAPFAFAPDLHFLVGGGWERLDENVPHHHAHEHHEPHVDADFDGDWHHDDLAVGRVGGSYLLHFGRRGEFVLAPQLFYDVVEGRGRNAVVFGIGFGYLF